MKTLQRKPMEFESLVNTEGFKTYVGILEELNQFESLVNTEGFKTIFAGNLQIICLRVLLIRKDSKPDEEIEDTLVRLRVLLIRKDSKLWCMCEC